jgi:CAAX prenyl protease-like protein
VAPFAGYLLLMALRTRLALDPGVSYPASVLLVAAGLLYWSRGLIRLHASRWGPSVLVGGAVFVIWIGPDLLWPGYRSHWLFANPLTGAAASSIPVHARASAAFLLWRVAGSVALIPIIEELFWRAWLMRYLISRRFETLPLGASSPGAFWISALLFASEHGPYWDVGLAAGILYNWWMVRTRSLADCVLAHAVTNACLAAYVVLAGQWQYWL